MVVVSPGCAHELASVSAREQDRDRRSSEGCSKKNRAPDGGKTLLGFSPRRRPIPTSLACHEGRQAESPGNRSASRTVSTATVPGPCRNRPCPWAVRPGSGLKRDRGPGAEQSIESARAFHSSTESERAYLMPRTKTPGSGISSSSAPPRRHRPQRRSSRRECARWHSGPPGPWGFRAHVRARPCARCCRPVR